jgi:sec-independent protein translocase protein TatA
MGIGEVIILLVVLVLIFGANKIPQLGDALGKGVRNFKKATSGDDAIDVTPRNRDDARLGTGAPTAPPRETPSSSEAKKL